MRGEGGGARLAWHRVGGTGVRPFCRGWERVFANELTPDYKCCFVFSFCANAALLRPRVLKALSLPNFGGSGRGHSPPAWPVMTVFVIFTAGERYGRIMMDIRRRRKRKPIPSVHACRMRRTKCCRRSAVNCTPPPKTVSAK